MADKPANDAAPGLVKRVDRRQFIACALAAVATCDRTTAQVAPTVRGSKADLIGVTRLFVDTDVDKDLGRIVTAEVTKQLPELHIVDVLEDADLVLRCSRTVASDKPGFAATEPPFSASDGSRNPARPTSDVHRARVDDGLSRGDSSDDLGDELDDAEAGPKRFFVGSVLRRAGSGPMHEALAVQQPVRTNGESIARDFVRKFAKEYRKANASQ